MIDYAALPRTVPGCGPQLRELNAAARYTDKTLDFLDRIRAEAAERGAVSAMVVLETRTQFVYRVSGAPDTERRIGRLFALLIEAAHS